MSTEKINKKVEKRIMSKIESIEITVNLIPSEFEDEDVFRASNAEYEVESFGENEEDARNNAVNFLKELFFNNLNLLD